MSEKSPKLVRNQPTDLRSSANPKTKKRKPTKETQCIIVKLLKTEVKGKKTEK